VVAARSCRSRIPQQPLLRCQSRSAEGAGGAAGAEVGAGARTSRSCMSHSPRPQRRWCRPAVAAAAEGVAAEAGAGVHTSRSRSPRPLQRRQSRSAEAAVAAGEGAAAAVEGVRASHSLQHQQTPDLQKALADTMANIPCHTSRGRMRECIELRSSTKGVAKFTIADSSSQSGGVSPSG